MSEETTKTEVQETVSPPEVKPQPDAAVSPETEGQPPAEAQKTDKQDNVPSTWEEIFQHPRFKTLIDNNKAAQEKLAALEAEKDEAAKAQETAEQAALAEQGKWEELFKQEREKLEKLEAKRKDAESEAKAARLELLRLKVATSLDGFPQKLASRLQGETEDELMADAQAILADLPTGPAVNTKTDAKEGTNTTAPRPIKTDLEIQEEAARSGVSFEHLKQYYEQQQMKH